MPLSSETPSWILSLEHIEKEFVFHHQQGTRMTVFNDFSHQFYPGKAAICPVRPDRGNPPCYA